MNNKRNGSMTEDKFEVNKVLNETKKRDCLKSILIGGLYAILIVPFLLTTRVTLFSADDFSFAVSLMQYRNESSNWIVALSKYAWNHYIDWSGRWICAFFPVGVNPLAVSDNPFGLLKVEMVVAFLLFSVAFIYMIVCILEDIFEIRNKTVIFLVAWVCLAILLNTHVYSEIFFWYTGVVYITLVIFEIMSISYGIRYFKHEGGKSYTIPFAFAGFCACDNLYAIVPLMLLFLYYEYKKMIAKKLKARDIVLFLLFAISSAMNVFAPGNFVRHDAIDSSGLHFFHSVFYTFYVILKASLDTISTPLVIFVLFSMILGLAFGMNGKRFDVKISHVFIYACLSMFGVIYPVSLGYSNINLSNRVLFVFCIHFIIYLFLIFFTLGNGCIAAFLSIYSLGPKTWIAPVLVIVAISFITVPGWIKDTPYYVMVADYYDDVYTYNQWRLVFEQIETSDEADVLVYTQNIRGSRILKNPVISTDSNSWINVDIARYYGKNSVSQMEE